MRFIFRVVWQYFFIITLIFQKVVAHMSFDISVKFNHIFNIFVYELLLSNSPHKYTDLSNKNHSTIGIFTFAVFWFKPFALLLLLFRIETFLIILLPTVERYAHTFIYKFPWTLKWMFDQTKACLNKFYLNPFTSIFYSSNHNATKNAERDKRIKWFNHIFLQISGVTIKLQLKWKWFNCYFINSAYTRAMSVV